MVQDNTASATKNDILLLEGKMAQWKEETIRHFDVVAEQLHHDVIGANRDEVELVRDKQKNHEHRIQNLERHTGVIAA
ncbi:MAG: hypothetical protein ABIA92_01150 [Patescibacteria group bacterium]